MLRERVVERILNLAVGRIVGATLFIVIVIWTTYAIGKPIVIRFSYVVSVNTPKGKAAEYLAKLVKNRTHGKVIIRTYPNAILFNDRAAIEALQMNSIQMACPAMAKFSSWIPQIQLFDLPFLFNNLMSLHRVMDGRVGKKILSLFKSKGLVGLAYWDGGFKVISDRKRPIVLPRDCKGLVFRVMRSNVLKEQFKVVGAYTKTLPFSDVFLALKNGVIDGFENTWSNIYTRRFYKVSPYITETYHGYLGYVLVTNVEFWNSLSPKLREIIESCVRDATIYERKLARDYEKKQRELVLEDSNVKDIILTRKQREIWKKTLRKVYPKFYSVIGKKLIEEAIEEQQLKQPAN